MAQNHPDLSDLTRPGAEIAVRVTPKAARDRITRDDTGLRIYTTTVPENGKANVAAARILAKALGVPKTALTLLRGQTSRDKVFRIDL